MKEYITDPSAAIDVRGLSKSYGSLTALDDISFTVRQGELFGLIGPDGAGKTTLFRLLTTLINPDRGEASVDGLDIVKDYPQIRQRVGYMPGRFSLYPDLTVEENLTFFAALFNVKIADNYELIAPIYRQIEPFRKRKAGNLSGGMKQKLALSCALIHRPSVLFLDEPTTGVDAVSRNEFWEMLSTLKQQRISILVSTPYMDEASRCDRVALINNGHLLAIDTPQAIVDSFKEPLYALSGEDMFGLLKAVRNNPQILQGYPCGQTHHMVTTPDFNASQWTEHLTSLGFRGVSIQPIRANIEDVFIKCMENE